MPNGVRHVLGLLAGLVLAPVTALGLLYGTERMQRIFQVYFFRPGTQWTPILLLTAVAVVLGVLVGSRLSPLASLVPGVLFGVPGLLWAVAPEWTLHHTARKLPGALDRGYQVVGPYGVLLVLGLLLLVGSVPPSRWRPREVRTPARHSYESGSADGGSSRGGTGGTFFPPEPQDARPVGYRDRAPALPGAAPAPASTSAQVQGPSPSFGRRSGAPGQGPAQVPGRRPGGLGPGQSYGAGQVPGGQRPPATDPGRGRPVPAPRSGQSSPPGQGSAPGQGAGYQGRDDRNPPEWGSPPPGPSPFRPS
jgi:hypothetical protein